MYKIATLPNLNLIQVTLYLSLGVVCQGWIPTPYIICCWGAFFLFNPPLMPRRSIFVACLTALMILVMMDFSTGLHWNRTLLILVHYFTIASIYFYVRFSLDSLQRKSLSIVLITLLLINCLGSIYQVFISPGIQPLSWVPEGGVKRAFGLFDNPNLFASSLMMGIFVAFKFWRDRRSSVLPLILLIITLMLTQSRGAILGLSLGFVLLFYYERARVKIWILSFSFICLLGFSLIMTNRSLSPSELGVNQRVELLQGIQNYLESEWLTGSGAGTFHLEYPFYRTLGGKYPLYAHNHILEIWCELGIAGFILVIVWIIRGLSLAIHRRNNDPLLLAFIVACIVNSSTNQSFSYFVVASIFGVCIALLDENTVIEAPVNLSSRKYIWKFGAAFICTLGLYQYQWNQLAWDSLENKRLPYNHLSDIDIFWKQDSKLFIFFCNQFSDDREARSLLLSWGEYLQSRYPRESEIVFQMANLSSKQNDISKASMYAYQSLALDPYSERYTAWLMKLEYDRNRHAKVIQLAEKVIGSNPQYEGINPWYDKIYELYLSSLVVEQRAQKALKLMQTGIRWVDKNLGERVEQVISQNIELSNPKLMQ